MIIDPFILNILDLNNNKHSVHCLGSLHTIEYIKFILSSDIGLPCDQVKLYIGNTELINELRLEDYKIDKHSIIRMFFTVRAGRFYI